MFKKKFCWFVLPYFVYLSTGLSGRWPVFKSTSLRIKPSVDSDTGIGLFRKFWNFSVNIFHPIVYIYPFTKYDDVLNETLKITVVCA